jgi:hypothetical protein
MNEIPKPSRKALRKRVRRIENDRLAAEAKFWNAPRSAEQLGYTRPVNSQAAKELGWRALKKPGN